MEAVLILAVLLIALFLAGAGVSRGYGRNAEEMIPDRGDRVSELPGFDRRDGPL